MLIIIVFWLQTDKNFKLEKTVGNQWTKRVPGLLALIGYEREQGNETEEMENNGGRTEKQENKKVEKSV